MTNKICFLDTGIFYSNIEKLSKVLDPMIDNDWSFAIDKIVVYEFIGTVTDEINKLVAKGMRQDRVEKLRYLLNRFPIFLKDFEIEILIQNENNIDIDQFFLEMGKYKMNIGDILILFSLKSKKISKIVTTDKDWERVNDQDITAVIIEN